MISIQFGAKGSQFLGGHGLRGRCACRRRRFEIIKYGKADAMITGGVESVVTRTCIAGFGAMKALSHP
jgi:3-oxoacyl-[acyl-carrier-protein] synthase II